MPKILLTGLVCSFMITVIVFGTTALSATVPKAGYYIFSSIEPYGDYPSSAALGHQKELMESWILFLDTDDKMLKISQYNNELFNELTSTPKNKFKVTNGKLLGNIIHSDSELLMIDNIMIGDRQYRGYRSQWTWVEENNNQLEVLREKQQNKYQLFIELKKKLITKLGGKCLNQDYLGKYWYINNYDHDKWPPIPMKLPLSKDDVDQLHSNLNLEYKYFNIPMENFNKVFSLHNDDVVLLSNRILNDAYSSNNKNTIRITMNAGSLKAWIYEISGEQNTFNWKTWKNNVLGSDAQIILENKNSLIYIDDFGEEVITVYHNYNFKKGVHIFIQSGALIFDDSAMISGEDLCRNYVFYNSATPVNNEIGSSVEKLTRSITELISMDDGEFNKKFGADYLPVFDGKKVKKHFDERINEQRINSQISLLSSTEPLQTLHYKVYELPASEALDKHTFHDIAFRKKNYDIKTHILYQDDLDHTRILVYANNEVKFEAYYAVEKNGLTYIFYRSFYSGYRTVMNIARFIRALKREKLKQYLPDSVLVRPLLH